MSAPLFCLSGVSFAYDGGSLVLNETDFTLSAGEKVAISGANGAGKTTLFHLMVGLLKPQAGSIEAFGLPRRSERDFHAVRTQAGLLFQDPDDQLFCPTVAEDVAFGPLNLGKSPSQAREITTQTLARLGLQGFENRITHKLSGGERRLVSLAAVLAMSPQVLLLDEPTNALDDATAQRLTDILLSLPQAMVVISHDQTFLARISTRRATLSGGKLRD